MKKGGEKGRWGTRKKGKKEEGREGRRRKVNEEKSSESTRRCDEKKG